MNRRTKRKIRRFLWMTWEWVKVVAVVLFAMAGGAACYHQYLAQHHMLRTERQAAVEEEPEPIEQSYIMTPEEIEEEEKADELELMAICVEAEAGNQSLTGKRMVADVILNRVDNPDFPDNFPPPHNSGRRFAGSPAEDFPSAVRKPSEKLNPRPYKTEEKSAGKLRWKQAGSAGLEKIPVFSEIDS